MAIERVGIIGGGQLAKMTGESAKKLGIELIVQTPKSNDPAVSVATEVILAPVDDSFATDRLATHCDVITFENEFINLEKLQPLAERGVCFRPSLEALAPILDKYQQRCYLKDINLPVPQFIAVESQKAIESPFGYPVVLKARRHGYDGRGTFIIKDRQELKDTWERLERPSMMLEEFVPFDRELAVIAARSLAGEIVVYPVVETRQKEQVCRWVIAPAEVSSTVISQVESISRTLLEKLDVVGLFGIELFLTSDDKVLVNEIAPRTHNSGHYSLDACQTSQFEMHLRAVAGLSLGSPQLNCDRALMVNLLGYEHSQDDYQQKRTQLAQIPQARVHWYGKTESRPGRKLGHVTVLFDRENLKLWEKTARQIESIWYG